MSKISDELRTWALRRFGDQIAPREELDIIADRIDAEMVELPKDADVVPIHVGDTVYGEDGRAWHVEGISLGRWTKWAEGYAVHAMDDSGQWRDLMPERLTHECPDSLERIADELDEWSEDNRVKIVTSWTELRMWDHDATGGEAMRDLEYEPVE